MSCPYLTEVTMVFCRAYPVKKLVPSDQLSTESRCDGEAFRSCSVFDEVSGRLGRVVREMEVESHAAPKGRGP